MLLQMSVSKILAHSRLWYFKSTKIFTEMTSNMIYIVAFGVGVGLKCPHKIHLNTQCLGVIRGINGVYLSFWELRIIVKISCHGVSVYI